MSRDTAASERLKMSIADFLSVLAPVRSAERAVVEYDAGLWTPAKLAEVSRVRPSRTRTAG